MLSFYKYFCSLVPSCSEGEWFLHWPGGQGLHQAAAGQLVPAEGGWPGVEADWYQWGGRWLVYLICHQPVWQSHLSRLPGGHPACGWNIRYNNYITEKLSKIKFSISLNLVRSEREREIISYVSCRSSLAGNWLEWLQTSLRRVSVQVWLSDPEPHLCFLPLLAQAGDGAIPL